MVMTEARRVSEYFNDFKRGRRSGLATGKLTFAGVGGMDVYNITAPFSSANLTAVAGRVEPRDQEISTVIFFREKDGVWHPIPGRQRIELQDLRHGREQRASSWRRQGHTQSNTG
jgi:hypothetical protein